MSTQWKSPAAKNGRGRPLIRPEPMRLERNLDQGIIPANLRAIEVLYFTAMLEEARVFHVVERLAAMFGQGLLPADSGPTGEILYRHWKAGHNRLTAAERRTVFVRAFGFAGGDVAAAPNSEFEELWVRFLSTVGMYAAELQLPAPERSVSQEEVRRSGHDLAVNLSAHAHGMAWFAAQELQLEIRELLSLLSHPEITEAFGAKNLWQLVEHLASSASGKRLNIPRSRTRAESGRTIIRWLANHSKTLLRPPPARVLKDDDIRKQRVAVSEEKRQSHPTDYDLVNACGQWLAVTGTQESHLEE